MNKKYDSYLYLENEGRRTFIKGAGVDEKGMMSQAVAGLGNLAVTLASLDKETVNPFAN